jgi:hypothetical protein
VNFTKFIYRPTFKYPKVVNYVTQTHTTHRYGISTAIYNSTYAAKMHSKHTMYMRVQVNANQLTK